MPARGAKKQKLILCQDAVRMVLGKPDMTADEKMSIVARIQAVREVDIIPHVCGCCIGCEMEKEGSHFCDYGFVLSIRRAKDYLAKVVTKQSGRGNAS